MTSWSHAFQNLQHKLISTCISIYPNPICFYINPKLKKLSSENFFASMKRLQIYQFKKSELSHCFKSLLNMNNNFIQNIIQNWIIQFFCLNLSWLCLLIGKSLILPTWGNKNIITSVESAYWLNTGGKQAKEFLFFEGFLSVTHTLLFCLSFLWTQLEGNNKTRKTKAFFDHGKNTNKNTFAFL